MFDTAIMDQALASRPVGHLSLGNASKRGGSLSAAITGSIFG
jgi:hypothetical protein